MKSIIYQYCRSRMIGSTLIKLGVLALISLSPIFAWADDPLCFQYVDYSTPYPNQYTPAIDGLDGADTTDISNGATQPQEWRLAGDYTFSSGLTEADANVRLAWDANKLYLLFDVHNDPSYDNQDLIILVIGSPIGTTADDYRIHINPVSNSGTSPGSNARQVKVWRDSTPITGWEAHVSTPNETDPAWIVAKVKPNGSGLSGSTVGYRVEVGLERSHFPLLLSGVAFPFHFNVLRKYNTTTSSGSVRPYVAGQLNWPTDAKITGVNLPSIPPPAGTSLPLDSVILASPLRGTWGQATLASPTTGCQGVKVKDRWVNTPANNRSSRLDIPPVGGSVTNNYYVQIENMGTAPSGNILATIRSARFGISNFFKVPATPNPLRSYSSTTPGPISPGSVMTLGPAAWTIDRATFESTYYPSGTVPLDPFVFVCSLVELEADLSQPAGVARTLIANRYNYWNTHFASASVFDFSAALNATDFPRSPTGTTQEFHLITSAVAVGKVAENRDIKGQSSLLAEVPYARYFEQIAKVGGMPYLEKGAHFYSKNVCGYRYTAQYIMLDGELTELREKTPCYGYWIYHLGDFVRWDDKLSGPGLKSLGGNINTITVNANETVMLNTRIETIEKPKAPCIPGCGSTTNCPQAGSALQANDNKLAGTGFLWVGMAGIGAVAFTRRRRNKSDKEL